MKGSAVSLVVENTVALGVAVFIGVLWCGGALKSLQRSLKSSGRESASRADRVHAAASYQSGAVRTGCGVS